MYILGLNMGTTQDGAAQLKDGGAALMVDGKLVVAVAEERVNRQKHGGGFTHAVRYCLDHASLRPQDVDMVVVSSCSEEPLKDFVDIGLAGVRQDRIRVIPSHHLSHAYAAHAASPFEESVVMVVDNEGNLLGQRAEPDRWRSRFERNSYYVATGDEITTIPNGGDNLRPDELGLGEAYRYFTYYLGWHSYVYAGKTMGLAPYGVRDCFSDISVFRLVNGEVRCLLENTHRNPIESIRKLGVRFGTDLGPPRPVNGEITQRHRNLACLIQEELEEALVYKANRLFELTGVRNLCLSGGVALNCVANRRILEETPFEKLYVPPAPGDSGQGVGNALYGWLALGSGGARQHMKHPYYGTEYSEEAIKRAIHTRSEEIRYEQCVDPSTVAARLVAQGQVVGWFQGQSEIGPRALGNRSILADPRLHAMADYLNLEVKKREAFRPYAPSILQECAHEWFENQVCSPFMSQVATVLPSRRQRVPSVTHVDGTSRVQTVTREQNLVFHRLISSFQELTGVPMVLNTSFNLAGEPIVETPIDALDCFLRSKLDCLFLHDHLIRRVDEPPQGRFYGWLDS